MTPQDTAQRLLPPRKRTIHVDGVPWLVYEHRPGYDRRSSATLVFESAAAIRRVRDYPPNWWTLSDEELMEVSWRR